MSSTALITGASSGLGAEFASQLAARGHDVVLVARSGDRLEAEARRIRAEHGVKAEVIVQDLVEPDAAQRIKIKLDARGLQVGLLVNNAGFGTCGRFEEISGARDHDQLMVNVVALVDLSHELLPGMLANGGGAVVNIASTAAFQPSPYFAVYSAAKTFVLNFSLALRNEYRGRGVKVLAVCPGPVPTGFVEAIGNEKAASFGALIPADRVVRTALRALDRDRAYVTPGLGNALNAHLMPRRPRALVAAISERVTRTVLDGGAKDGASAGAGAATAAVAP
ncbi:SDR family NAD(P)-dependent oxidoreductase [Glycomyces algeriensis]|uniref:NADP-dependent 3-hydroxy acid dehydrogenase YdfG n=1 Tax=Glycomyces algeriensis TaxID=256037 RepID=A0A9W6G563_9ACTN|nr:SDR family oxidoreductase [Glycomyces algeriensis]MDA1366820.1 SDR family oxidoreductase [Glycomyces algeriensis]MDA1368930.1 SDR family oxidoreductase [Glycomyces algeriensis]MDR7352795.1 short-subunit dehydrogenase [Glycomyces algeriensis]GLI40478.1 ketoacyl reductase [Glycomyces algeriensis]